MEVNMYGIRLSMAVLFLLIKCCDAQGQPAADYHEMMLTWHQDRVKQLKSSEGWLTVCGLHWLKHNPTTIGSSQENQIVLPPSAPKKWGQITWEGEELFFEEFFPGNPKGKVQLQYQETPATIISQKNIQWFLLKRGDRLGVRVRDTLHANRMQFDTVPYFPIDLQWKIAGKFIPADDQDSIKINNVLGMSFSRKPAGYLEFEYDGHLCRLSVLDAGSKLFLIYSDGTTGSETYGGGRYLYLDKPEHSAIEIDFNKSENPPCVFTAYATCLLPPAENKLEFAVRAGEKTMQGH